VLRYKTQISVKIPGSCGFAWYTQSHAIRVKKKKNVIFSHIGYPCIFYTIFSHICSPIHTQIYLWCTHMLIHRRAYANTTPQLQPQIFYLKTLFFSDVAVLETPKGR